MLTTPLAWKNLTHQPARLVIYLAGVIFAVTLMFIQLGFQNALLDSTVQTVNQLDADLLIVSNARYAFPIPETFPRDRIDLAASTPGVASAKPVYSELLLSTLKTDNEPRGYPIRVLAADDPHHVFGFIDSQQATVLNHPNSALLDRKSRLKFKLPMNSVEKLRAETPDLAGKPIRLKGYFSLGTDFAAEGNLVMTSDNFARYFQLRGNGDPLSQVDLGLIKVDEGVDIKAVQAELQNNLPKLDRRLGVQDIVVLTIDEYITQERQFWEKNTPVGSIFFVGMIMGFVVGVIICYQIIYTCVDDYLAEFATLVAMGYSAWYFIGVILWTSLYLSVLGFIPGFAVSYCLYALVEWGTGLPMNLLQFKPVITVYLLTLGMCVISGLFTVRKVLSVDPAELF